MLRFDEKNVVIDVGKTFRESLVRWFPTHNVKSVDAIILTHPHADAIFGLDDVRSLQGPTSPPMNVFLTEECYNVVARMFPYLTPNSDLSGRKVSSISWLTIEQYSMFEVCGLPILPVPVMHGEDLKCMGFLFGRNETVCYLSDISRMLPETMEAIQMQEIDLLIIDSLFISTSHGFHFSLDEAIALSKLIRPKKVRFVGMTSEFEHDKVNERLAVLSAEEGIDFQLAYDGLFIAMDL